MQFESGNGSHGLKAHNTRERPEAVYATVAITSNILYAGRNQFLLQYDETAKLILTTVILNARDERVAIIVAKTTHYSHTTNKKTNRVANFQTGRDERNPLVDNVDDAMT